MIWPSINPVNCWNALKPVPQNMAGNGECDGLKSYWIKQWEISSQASKKLDEGSTTKRCSLNQVGTAKRSRAQGFFSGLFIGASTIFASMMSSGMKAKQSYIEIIKVVVCLVTIKMMDNFVFIKKPSKVIFNYKPMLSYIPFFISEWVSNVTKHNIPIMSYDLSGMKLVCNFKSICTSGFRYCRACKTQYCSNFMGGKTLFRKSFNLIDRNKFSGSINSKPVHVIHNTFFAYPIFFGNFIGRAKAFIVFIKNLLCKLNAYFSTPLHNLASFAYSQHYITIVANFARKKDDIVWTNAKALEGGIKSPPITFPEIKNQGDKVIIRQTPDITISDYSKNMTLAIQRPEEPVIEFPIEKAKYFNFILDDIDKYQSDIKLMNDWSRDAGQQMKIAIDSGALADFYSDAHASNKGATAGVKSADINLGVTGAPVAVTKTNILDLIIDNDTVLDEQDAPEEGRWIVIPPWFRGMVMKSDLKDASMTGDGQSILRNGRIGRIGNFTLYVSNLLTSVTDGALTCWHVPAGQMKGLTFASQMTKMEQLRAESTFGNLVRGLNVYDYKVLKTEAIVDNYVRKAA